MSTTHDIDDNDEALFQFDPFDSHQPLLVPPSPHLPFLFGMSLSRNPATTSAHATLLPSDNDVGPTDVLNTKGKARTMPMPIRQSTIVRDLFEISPQKLSSPMSYDSSSSVLICSPSTSNFSSDSNSLLRHHCSFLTEDMEQAHSLNSVSGSYTGKGKEKALFPMLPPLTFSNIDLDYDQVTPFTPGPYDDRASLTINEHGMPPSSAVSVTDIPFSSPSPSRSLETDVSLSKSPASRCRSLTNLSHLAFPPSVGPPSTSTETPGAPVNQPRHLLALFDNKNDEHVVNNASSTLDLQVIPSEFGNNLPAWYTTSETLDAKNPSRARDLFRPKGRSRSSPCPISALDIIPNASTDIFQPLPIVIPNYFDLVLPKELRLHILRALVDLHGDDHQRSILEGRFTVAKATSSRGRWVGRDKGIRELFKLSRVSKSWQALIFDGQLWGNLDLHSFPGLPQETIIRIVQSSGSFIRSLNFAGHTNLAPDTMGHITNGLCFKNPNLPLSYNQLTSVDFQGCTSLTTRSLHQLLVRSRALKSLSLKGLSVVTNTTCDIISNFCPNLISLNMSRCVNMDAEGIRSLVRSAMRRRDYLKLKDLRLSGLKNLTDTMMTEIGQAAPFLEVLDLSYSRQLHNSAIEAFVACDEELHGCQTSRVDTVLVTARDLGREASDSSSKMIRRRVTRLRHLLLSHCIMLTDIACANLTHSVPNLEFLELAGIGADLKDAGLIRLLQQTPFIRRLDLEDASEITDAVIRTVTPAPEIQENPVARAKQPGHVLQHLNISYAASVSDDALLTLIRNCKYLTTLEADNTRINKNVLKEFVRISRQRRTIDARIVAIDCRGISESLVKELSPMTRPRLAFRRYDARKLNYLDARDDNEDELKVGQDECDEDRVVIKTFYSWQTVDAVKAIRDKRRKTTSRKLRSESSNGEMEGAGGAGRGSSRRSAYTRWWSPSGRRSRNSTTNSGSVSPLLQEMNGGDGCLVM